MIRRVAIMLVGALLPNGPAHAQMQGSADKSRGGTPPAYHLKPPDISIPPGTKPGVLRRIIQPFGPWTLICDENLKARTHVCNVSQTILDSAGRLVFSWSLAATKGGAPVFIVRTAANGVPTRQLHLAFGGDPTMAADVALSSCDATICIGFLPDDRKLQRQIDVGARVHVRIPNGTLPTTFETTLDGLAAAVASLK